MAVMRRSPATVKDPVKIAQEDLFSAGYLDLGMAFLFGRTLYTRYPMNGSESALVGFQASS
jgi:hypothetical protein